VAYTLQTGKNKAKLLTEYESVIQKVLFGNAVLVALMSWRKYDVIPQNGDCSRESNMKSVIKTRRRYRTQYGNDPPSDNAIRRWVKQFQETGCVLHREGRALRRKLLIESRKRFLEARLDMLRSKKDAHVEVI
jgi:heterodisulfide reductase subunit C